MKQKNKSLKEQDQKGLKLLKKRRKCYNRIYLKQLKLGRKE